MSEDLQQRLQRIEDLLEIQQLFIDYGQYLDTGRFAEYARLFAQEGEVQLGPLGRAKGPAEIEALMTDKLASQVGDSYHIISSPMVTIDGDTAESEVMWTVVNKNAEGKPYLNMVGRHKDKLIREKGRWKFLRRRGFVDIPTRMVT